MLTKEEYTAEALARARGGAEDWLRGHDDGYPRSWGQESADTVRRDYEAYDRDFEAPPIAGYEALEQDGFVERVGTLRERSQNQERVHFRITTAGRSALSQEGQG